MRQNFRLLHTQASPTFLAHTPNILDIWLHSMLHGKSMIVMIRRTFMKRNKKMGFTDEQVTTGHEEPGSEMEKSRLLDHIHGIMYHVDMRS